MCKKSKRNNTHLVALSTHTQNDQKLSQHIQPTTTSLIFPNSKPMIVMEHELTNAQKCGKGMGKQKFDCLHTPVWHSTLPLVSEDQRTYTLFCFHPPANFLIGIHCQFTDKDTEAESLHGWNDKFWSLLVHPVLRHDFDESWR